MKAYLERMKIIYLIMVERCKRIAILTKAIFMYIPLLLRDVLDLLLGTIILFVLAFAPLILLLIGFFILWVLISPNVIITW